MKILYLHGLGSSSRSTTAVALSNFGVSLLAPDYAPQHYQRSITQLCAVIEAQQPGYVIGTSMGGYYALKLFERFSLPTLVVNPCYNPAGLLQPYLAKPAWDYAAERPIHFSVEMLQAFEEVLLPQDSAILARLRVISGRKDDLIAIEGQRRFCRQHGIQQFETNWGHRVEDAAVLLQQLEPLRS